MLCKFLSITKSSDDCIFDYSFLLEIIKFHILSRPSPEKYHLLFDIIQLYLSKRDLDSPEHFYTLIYASFNLIKIDEIYTGFYNLSTEMSESIYTKIPNLVCSLLSEKEFEDKSLFALKYMYLIKFDKNSMDAFDPIEFRKQLSVLMNSDNNYMNYSLIHSALSHPQLFQSKGFAVQNQSKLEIFEKLFEYIGKCGWRHSRRIIFRDIERVFVCG